MTQKLKRILGALRPISFLILVMCAIAYMLNWVYAIVIDPIAITIA